MALVQAMRNFNWKSWKYDWLCWVKCQSNFLAKQMVSELLGILTQKPSGTNMYKESNYSSKLGIPIENIHEFTYSSLTSNYI